MGNHQIRVTNKAFKKQCNGCHLCNGCHDLIQKAMSFDNIAIVYTKGSAYRIYFWYKRKDDAINIMNGSNLVDKTGVL